MKDLTFNAYHQEALKTIMYPDVGNNFTYTVLGLVGESGEVAEKMKKILRDSEGHISPTTRGELLKELGDILWYISAAASELKSDLTEVAEINLRKVQGRLERGSIQGVGDNR